MASLTKKEEVFGYMPGDTPPIGSMISLGFQQVLTMFPATVLVAILTKFDVGVTLLAGGLGTIVALLVSRRRIPMYYGSSFSYITVVITVMSQFVPDCFNDPTVVYCPEGVRLVQVGIIGTAVFEILIGLLIMRVGKAALDKVLPPVITGSVAIVIGIALAGAALNMAGAHWGVAFITLIATVLFSVYLQGRGLLGMLPILLGAVVGYAVAVPLGLVDFAVIGAAPWLRVPAITLPAFGDSRAWGAIISISLIAIATIPESTAHLYQMSLYIDQLAKELGRAPLKIKNLIGLNLVADGCDDLVVGMLGGCAGTNYGENNSLMAITRNYSVPVLMVAAGIAIVLGFVGKLAAVVNTLPVAVTGGLSIYLFGVIGMQGVALIQSEKVNLFEPRQLAVGAIILVTGIGGNLALADGVYPFYVPVLFPNGIPAIVFAALVGILLNLVFLALPPARFGIKERENINLD
ncbi:MAG: xanthine permease [Chloroflexi bacterium]|jgi:uracil permease|nr:xanthine permease [Chloroflexota bacterium]MBK7179751.1 xanthine permease [Chloroflexota bacterium]MBK7919899.1 xanthine permease [Chloroflexota bacterium]MBP6806326.1 xanthine permease [Chloroflexota bacterium]